MKERIFLAIGIISCILLIMYSIGRWYTKLMGILIFIGVWKVYDSIFKSIFKDEESDEVGNFKEQI